MSRNTRINSRFLKALRTELGWTQTDLARHAKVSVRVVAKGEAGDPISAKSVSALAEAFVNAGKHVTRADFITSLEDIVREFLKNYTVYQADCVEKSRHLISPRIIAIIDGDPATNPIAGEYQGIDEFAGFFKKLFAIFVRDGGTLDVSPEIRVFGNEVFVWGHEAVRVPQADPQPAGFVMLRMHFEEGLMTYFENRYESNGMMLQLDKWSQKFPDAEWLAQVNRAALINKDYRKPFLPLAGLLVGPVPLPTDSD
jgi:transcriptional regulator with XRE-family HTH domain